MIEDYKYLYTDNIVCPYCGYKEMDSWELGDYDDNHECGSCEKVFAFERIKTVEYKSYPLSDKEMKERKEREDVCK
ncbi:MAG: hypothetical protein ABFD07_12720 [Methanobacterium sp.]